jgi:hypothetical protein
VSFYYFFNHRDINEHDYFRRVQFLRHVKDFLGLTFKLESHQHDDDDEDLRTGAPKVNITCIGIGYSNLGITVV